MADVVIIGGGFAGMWSAIGAVRALEEFGMVDAGINVTLIAKDQNLTLRPRLYEPTPAQACAPLDAVLGPVGVRRLEGTVTAIDPHARTISLDGQSTPLSYDRLVLAAGSALYRPNIPGLTEHAFAVDTHREAILLEEHLQALATRPASAGQFTAVVVGAGFTGLEVATEMVTRLQEVAAHADCEVRVVLVERSPHVAPYTSPEARAVIEEALRTLGVEVQVQSSVVAVTPEGVTLHTGDFIPAATTIWTAGLRASSLTRCLPVELDPLGRLPVETTLRVQGVEGIFAAGDVARARTDSEHFSLMSCQHAIPQGKLAGYNVVADLLDKPMVPYDQPDYVTCLDLGAWGALFTEGWDKAVRYTGAEAKKRKRFISQVICPPLAASRSDLLGRIFPTPSTDPTKRLSPNQAG